MTNIKSVIQRASAVALAAVMTFAALPMTVLANDSATITVTIDGHPVTFPDQTPVILEGRTLVPVREVFENLDFQVDWYEAVQMVTLTRPGHEVALTLGSDIFITNGQEFHLDVPAQIINNRTLLPLRAIIESVGYSIDWNEATQTVLIETILEVVPAVNDTRARDREMEKEVFRLLNEERASQGRHALIWYECLAEVALAHSQNMHAHNMVEHILDGKGSSDRVAAAGIDARSVRENLTMRSSAESAMSAWMNSGPHRGAMLDGFTHVGMGFYRGYWTMKLMQVRPAR